VIDTLVNYDNNDDNHEEIASSAENFVWEGIENNKL
jgi:hypothetical protein